MRAAVTSAVTLVLSVAPGIGRAAVVGTAPEPGTFELFALAGVVAAVIAIRNRRKK
jgi:hypothetical protein